MQCPHALEMGALGNMVLLALLVGIASTALLVHLLAGEVALLVLSLVVTAGYEDVELFLDLLARSYGPR
jgi:hypothetical protein